VVAEARFYFSEGDGALEEFFKGSGFAIGDAARDDEIEIAEIGRDIVSETVGGDPAADVDADGSEFFFLGSGLDPNAGFARDAVSGDAEIGGGPDHGFFEGAHVPAYVTLDFVEIEDGITDDLAWTMVGYVPAAIGGVEFDISLTENVFGSEEIRTVGVAAEGNNVSMLAEEENVVDRIGFSGGDEVLLKGVGVGIGDEAKVGG
jgi:hypothetical protein